MVDLTAITAKINNANPSINSATCSVFLSVSAPATIVSGTGLYKTISGTVNLTESFGFILSRHKSGPKKGQCNLANSAVPIAHMATVFGTGSVSF